MKLGEPFHRQLFLHELLSNIHRINCPTPVCCTKIRLLTCCVISLAQHNTNRQKTMRTNGQPSEQLLPKRWPLSNPNRTKSIMNKRKVKHHRNSDTKPDNSVHIRTTALERSVMNYWGLKYVLRAQPHPP